MIFRKFIMFWLARRNPVAFARRLGVKVGSGCKLVSVSGSTFGSEPYLVEIGDHVEVAGEVCFLTHDGGAWIFRKELPELDVFGAVKVGNNVFIGRRATILPGTEIGDNCVIGAGSVVRGKLEAGGVYAGVPVRRIRSIEEYKEKLVSVSLNCKQLSGAEKKNFLIKHFAKF